MTNIYVGNLSFRATEAELSAAFSQYGSVSKVSIVMDRETGRSRGFGFVEMQADDAAQRAISAMHEKEFDGRPLTVNEAKPRESGGGGGGGRGGYGGGRRY